MRGKAPFLFGIVALVMLLGCGGPTATPTITTADLMRQILLDQLLRDTYCSDAEKELMNVQTATITMMTDSNIALLPNPVTKPTNNMAAFPDGTTPATTKVGPYGEKGVEGDGDGYLLFAHDIVLGDGAKIGVNYLARSTTKYEYTVLADGTVTQKSFDCREFLR